MEPDYVGINLVVLSQQGEINVGDDIAYYSERANLLVFHRVVSKYNGTFVKACGINGNTTSIFCEWVDPRLVIGKKIAIF